MCRFDFGEKKLAVVVKIFDFGEKRWAGAGKICEGDMKIWEMLYNIWAIKVKVWPYMTFGHTVKVCDIYLSLLNSYVTNVSNLLFSCHTFQIHMWLNIQQKIVVTFK